MRFPFRSSRGWWLGAAAATLCSVLLLQGCDNERITTTEEGFTTENEVYAKWGQPENVWDGPEGERILEYNRQPQGVVNYMISIGPDGKVTALRQVRNLVVQGASTGASGPVPRAAIAAELEGLRDALLEQANSTYLSRPVFAGTTSAGHAYEVTPGDPPTYEWLGHEAGSVQRRVGPATTVRADSDGRLAFGDGDDSVFALIDRIVAELRAEDGEVGHFLADIDVRMEKMLAELADVGARYKQLTAAQVATEEAMVGLKGQIAAIEDIDLAEALVELQSQEVAYQAALGATARVLQPSLLDFIR